MPGAPLVLGILGVALVLLIVWDAFETVLVPRRIGRKYRLTRWFYILTWRGMRAVALGIPDPSRREGLLGIYGPLSLLVLLSLWASGLIFAFALLLMATHAGDPAGSGGLGTYLYMSGETFFTLGFGDITPTTAWGQAFAVVESGLGFAFLGTVVGYLPTLYSAFSNREIEISLMDARAGSPPTAVEFLRRAQAPAEPERVHEVLRDWERWSVQLLETHLSYPQLAYYRSQHVNQSWLALLTMILDSTAVLLARSGGGERTQAHLTFAMARHALVDVTQLFLQDFRGPGPDRLSPRELGELHALLALEAPGRSREEFESRLSELRLLYEPYAQALAGFLLFDLPPWAPGQVRRDNWERGPWDALLPGTEEALRREQHF